MVPNGPVSGVIRIFVKCGPIQRELVEVDLILAGKLHTVSELPWEEIVEILQEIKSRAPHPHSSYCL